MVCLVIVTYYVGIDCEVSIAYCRSSSGDSVDFLSRTTVYLFNTVKNGSKKFGRINGVAVFPMIGKPIDINR